MIIKAATPEAYQLLHDGALAFADVEANGIRVDMEYLSKTKKELTEAIREKEAKLRKDEIFNVWRKTFGAKTNIDAREQLGVVLFDKLKFPARHFTETGKPKMDETAFEDLDIPFAKDYIWIQKRKKVRDTFLASIEREVVPKTSRLHPFFNLHIPRTYRSSSDSPNFQNFPVRDEELAEFVRKCFVADDDNYALVEIDYSGIEVRVAACYNKDPVLTEYIMDSSKDMHRDMASQCFKLPADKVTKQIRYCGKNMFVFPQFYGDYYINNARALWEAIDRLNLTVDGKSLRRHLKKVGLGELGELNPKNKPKPGTFEYHIKEVENDFWNRRFRVYGQWKKSWFEKYVRTGGFSMKTGFRCEGVFSRKDVINYPVQGAAFHCLLASLIRLNRWLKKYKMRSKIVGQIHDSIVACVHVSELEDYLHTAVRIMTQRIPNMWKWISVPLEVEAEMSPPGGSWFDKKPITLEELAT